MSRRMNTHARGRQGHPSSTRAPQLKLTFGGKSGHKYGAKEITTIGKSIKKRRAPSSTESEPESESAAGSGYSDLEDGADDESDEADDESEDPEADAPSHRHTSPGEAGQFLSGQDEWPGFPEPDLPTDMTIDLFDVEDFEKKLFDSDDDIVYERVNEVSDSENDDDDEAIERAETELLTAEFNEDFTSHFANQIDGMSAYGFGDDGDEEGSIMLPFSSSDEGNDFHDRRVRFEELPTVGVERAFAMLAESPTMTRALLPSALPEFGDDADHRDAPGNADNDDGNDTDATEELEAPAQAWQPATRRRNSHTSTSPPVPKGRRISGQKGPVRGTFEDSGDKVTAMLDPTGKKLLLHDPHLLGGVFARRFGPSAPASPSVGFSDAVFGDSDSSQASGSPRLASAKPNASVDLMLSGLTSGEHASNDGQAIGIPEAFMAPTAGFFSDIVAGDIFDDAEEMDPEDNLRIEDMIAFDDADDDTDNPDSPMLPIFVRGPMSVPNTPLAHLNHTNITAFKRNTQQNYFRRPSYPDPIKTKFATPLKRKRHVKHDSPYSDAHYHGVTPVQRVSFMEHAWSDASSPTSSRTHKRRKTILW